MQSGLKISVLVPTRNRTHDLCRALRSLVAQRLSADNFEVVVVDNGSTDSTRADVLNFSREESKVSIRYVCENSPGLLAGRHRGAIESIAPLLVFIDDDISADPGWLASTVDAFNDEKVHMVGGPNLPRFEVDPPQWLAEFRRPGLGDGWWCSELSLLDFGRKRIEIDPHFIWGLNFAIRRETLLRVGGFHPDGYSWESRRYRGDGETAVSKAVKLLGFKAVYEPKAIVYHHVPAARLKLEYFERRSFMQGISDSYSAIRASRLPESDRLRSRAKRSQARWIHYLKAACRHFRKLAIAGPAKSGPQRWTENQERTQRAYFQGYEFHQSEVMKDPRLLAWVLRPDYWDYRLPDETTSAVSSDSSTSHCTVSNNHPNTELEAI